MGVQLSALLPVLKYVTINPFMTDTDILFTPQPVADLLRTPVFMQKLLYSIPGIRLCAGCVFRLSPDGSKSMCLFRSVASKSFVSANLTAYSRLVATDDSNNFGLMMTCCAFKA